PFVTVRVRPTCVKGRCSALVTKRPLSHSLQPDQSGRAVRWGKTIPEVESSSGGRRSMRRTGMLVTIVPRTEQGSDEDRFGKSPAALTEATGPDRASDCPRATALAAARSSNGAGDSGACQGSMNEGRSLVAPLASGAHGMTAYRPNQP